MHMTGLLGLLGLLLLGASSNTLAAIGRSEE